jgi:hypothetical protein
MHLEMGDKRFIKIHQHFAKGLLGCGEGNEKMRYFLGEGAVRITLGSEMAERPSPCRDDDDDDEKEEEEEEEEEDGIS